MKVGALFSVFDGDRKHFDRFLAELSRLRLPFAVNFDHCSRETKNRFQSHPMYLCGHEDDDQKSYFDESFRQRPLEMLHRQGFDWALSLDVDETLERSAPEKIKILATTVDAEVICCPVLDLWGDERNYRVDGTFASSRREKMFRLNSTAGTFEYYHPTTHAPKVLKPNREVKVHFSDLRVLHWGIMNMEDVHEHTTRWNTIYIRKVGKQPYGFYAYLNDPNTVPVLKEVPADV